MNKKILLLSWSLVVICMMFIFYLSSQQAKVSNAASKGIVKQSVDVGVKITRAQITEPEKLKLVDRINSIGREYMHGVVFLVLGILVQNAVSQSSIRRQIRRWSQGKGDGERNRKGIKTALVAFAICVVYGISDEIHQIFVPGRAFQVSDLLMDSLGSIIGILIVFMVYKKIEKRSMLRARLF